MSEEEKKGADTPAYSPGVSDVHGHYDDPYGYKGDPQPGQALVPAASGGNGGAPPPPPPPPDDPDEEDDGMLRMSFFDHLTELRTRILRSLAGVGVALVICILFADRLWIIVSEPAIAALTHLGYSPNLYQHTPMDVFTTVYVKLPLLASIFLSSPWILFQVWSFIAPGLYRKERRWAAPFVICTAGLFITGGLFAYFVAFRFGLEFLLGISKGIKILPVVSITEYFDLFVNVTLGIGLVFEIPVLIFFLTLLRVASPRFLLSHSRYAILAIVIIAAIVTPTPDAFNLMLFAVPMCALYFVGVFAGYLLVLKRENRKFPWKYIVLGLIGVLLLAAAVVAVLVFGFHFHLIRYWPFLTR